MVGKTVWERLTVASIPPNPTWGFPPVYGTIVSEEVCTTPPCTGVGGLKDVGAADAAEPGAGAGAGAGPGAPLVPEDMLLRIFEITLLRSSGNGAWRN